MLTCFTQHVPPVNSSNISRNHQSTATQRFYRRCHSLVAGCALTLILSSLGCWSSRPEDVVVYSALDREFSEPILQSTSQQAKLRVLPVFDLESTKTVGLVTRIEAEREHPSCDLFWNNEILHTLRLAEQGLLRPLHLPDETWNAFPATFRDPEKRWIGFAARARVLLINTDQLPDPQTWPRNVEALVDPQREEPRAIAKPTFGTTATHLAVLHERWGAEKFATFVQGLISHTTIVSGNKQVATGVASGEFAFGLTDTDDALVEIEKGAPVAIVFPDQQSDESGALFIPNTLSAPVGSPNPTAADQLIARLLTAEVEQQLAAGASGQIPLHQQVRHQSRVLAEHDAELRWMEVDWKKASAAWPAARRVLLEHWRD